MKKIQKKLSVVLAVMMVLCMFTALPFSASAAETSEETSAGNKINVTSNVTDPVSYDYNAQTEQVVVTYLLKADHMIVDTQSSLTYDSKVLKLASTTTTNTKNKVSLYSRAASFGIQALQIRFSSTAQALIFSTSSQRMFIAHLHLML